MAARHAILWIEDDEGSRWGRQGGETRTQRLPWEVVSLEGVSDELNNAYVGPDGQMVTIGIGPAHAPTAHGITYEGRPLLASLWDDLVFHLELEDNPSPEPQDDSTFKAKVHHAIDQVKPHGINHDPYVNGLCITAQPERALAAVRSYGLDPLHIWQGRAGLDAEKLTRDLALDMGWDGRPSDGAHRWLEHRLRHTGGGGVVFMDLGMVTPGRTEHKDVPIQLLSLLKHAIPFAIILEPHPQRVLFRGGFGRELANHLSLIGP